MYGQLEALIPFYILKKKQTTYLALKLLAAMNISSIYDNRSLQKIGQLKEMPRKSKYSSAIRKNIRNYNRYLEKR